MILLLVPAIVLLLVALTGLLRLIEWAFPSVTVYLDEHMPEKEWTRPW